MKMGFKSKFLAGLALFWGLCTYTFADVVIHGEKVIDKPTSYNNVTLDLTDGHFVVKTGGSLAITNSTVRVQISETNPYAVLLLDGRMILRGDTVNVTEHNIFPNADLKIFNFDLFRVLKGQASITQSTFTVDQPYTIGFFSTEGTSITNGMVINDNSITNFHGGVYLTNSNNSEVSRNKFSNVSFSNIWNNGNMNKFDGNIMVFPGNLHLGNAFDIFNSNGVTISNNIISSGSNYGVAITGGSNIFIKNNKITDGKDFAIIINTSSMAAIKKNSYLMQLLPKRKLNLFDNNNIIISHNYIEQNRYGITGGVVDNLIVINNIFIQRFNDPTSRQIWTNNDNLLPDVTNLSWDHNEYKEAFTQDNEGDNSLSLKFVTFPQRGGVVFQ